MGRFVFVVPPLTGHVNPTISLGAALLEQGHEVAWISLDAQLKQHLPEQGRLLLIEYDAGDTAKSESMAYLDAITRKEVYGVESVKFLYEEVLVPLNRYMYEGIVFWLQHYQPDVVINDHQLFAAAVAARQGNLPYATSVTAPAAIKMMEDLPMVHQWEVQQVVALQKELGLEGEASIACSPQLTLVFTSREFFGEMELPPYFRFVGPMVQTRPVHIPFPWKWLEEQPARPRVLVTIGTTFNHDYKKGFFSKVVEALKEEPVTVVVVSEPDLFEEWPANFVVQKRVPQRELLPFMQGVVCHAGHNTVCEALLCGLPLVVVPIAYDQSYVASRVVQVQAGIRLNFKRCKAANIQQAVKDILQQSSYKVAAAAIKTSFDTAGRAIQAVRLLETMAARIEYY